MKDIVYLFKCMIHVLDYYSVLITQIGKNLICKVK